MSIWYILLVTVTVNNNDVQVFAETRYPNTPEYNNEKTCNEVGQALVDQRQLEIGTKSGTTYFICQSVTVDKIKSALTKSGSNG